MRFQTLRFQTLRCQALRFQPLPTLLTLIGSILVACGTAPEPPAPPPVVTLEGDQVAAWHLGDSDGGSLTLAEIEEVLPEHQGPACQAIQGGAGGGLEPVVDCYREVAAALALEALVLDEIGDLDHAVDTLLVEEPELLRHALLDTFHHRLGDKVRQETEISDAEIEAYFEEHREEFRQPGQLTLWNLFRRHEDPEDSESTLEFLRQLKARVEAGESFERLAREHSHSETRLRDGLVGHLVEGQLPARLEAVAFALDDGEVSDPIAVKGGAVLLWVRHASEAQDFELDRVRGAIRARLLGQKVAAEVETLLAGSDLLEGAVVLDGDTLLEALDDDPAVIALDLAGERLDVATLRERLGLRPVDRVADLEPEIQERLVAAYEQQADRLRLVALLLASDDPVHLELRTEVEGPVRLAARQLLVDRWLEQALRQRAQDSPEDLRRYFDDNRALFQSPPRFRLTVWDLPLNDEPVRQLGRMEQLQRRLSAGEIELAAAVAELGGTTEDLGWRALDELPWDLPGKTRAFLLQTEPGGYSIPFKFRQRLLLLWVVERAEPEPLAFEEARPEVETAYLDRFGDTVLNALIDDRLTASGFRFASDVVADALGVAAPVEP